jgi:hypothetical protein
VAKSSENQNIDKTKELKSFLDTDMMTYFPGMKTYLKDKEFPAIYCETRFALDFPKFLLNILLLSFITYRCLIFMDEDKSYLRQSIIHNGHFFKSEIPAVSSIKQFIIKRYQNAIVGTSGMPSNLQI